MKNEDFNVAVGAALRAHRRGRELTQAALAELAGLSPNYVARLERGEMCPSLATAHALCRALDVSVETILKEAA